MGNSKFVESKKKNNRIPFTKGYSVLIKIAEAAIDGDSEKGRRYVKKYMLMYPESDLIYPFTHLLDGVKNPDGLILDSATPQK